MDGAQHNPPNAAGICSLYHKVFDLGAFTIRPADYAMVFSQHLVGNAEKLLSYHGACIQLPQSAFYLPRPEFLDWHEDPSLARKNCG